MPRKLLPKIAILLSLGAAQTVAAPTPEELAQTMMQTMGGQDAWGRAHFVRYDFKVTVAGKVVADRAHLWDKQTGRYRIEDKTKEGKPRVTLFNVGTQQGTVYVDGKKLEGEPAAQAMKQGYGTFINDMYWLSMPWKWMDQGVHLKYLGEKKPGFDVVELTFGKVGLTPGDRYDAFVSRKSHLMEHWEYTLQTGKTGVWDWQYKTTAGVMLAGDHKSPEGNSINMGDPRILNAADDAYFTDPNKKLADLK
jgi:hypothetical protein